MQEAAARAEKEIADKELVRQIAVAVAVEIKHKNDFCPLGLEQSEIATLKDFCDQYTKGKGVFSRMMWLFVYAAFIGGLIAVFKEFGNRVFSMFKP